MELKHQVTSLEISQRLKELGVKQESLFWWIGDILVFKTQTGFFSVTGAGMNLHPLAEKAISTFTVSELGDIIPASVSQTTFINEREDSAHIFFIRYDDDDSDCNGENPDTCIKTKYHAECGRVKFRELTEANARGKMLIYLLEHNLIPL